MIGHYDWAGGREAMLRFGPAGAPVVIAANALFEEANRTRALLVTVLRALAERGIASVLPDLPGANESLMPTEDARLGAWREAYAAAAASAGAQLSVAIRGGVLVDDGVPQRWRLSPVEGSRLVRELVRARQASARESGETFDPADLAPPGAPVELAGNHLSRELIAELDAATPGDATRTVRLAHDPLPADAVLPASPPWRRAEPDLDPALAALLVDDIEAWVRSCAA